MGDSENGKVQKDSPKGTNKGKGACWEITKMVKYRKASLKPLTKGKVLFGRARTVKHEKTALKQLIKGNVPCGR